MQHMHRCNIHANWANQTQSPTVFKTNDWHVQKDWGWPKQIKMHNPIWLCLKIACSMLLITFRVEIWIYIFWNGLFGYLGCSSKSHKAIYRNPSGINPFRSITLVRNSTHGHPHVIQDQPGSSVDAALAGTVISIVQQALGPKEAGICTQNRWIPGVIGCGGLLHHTWLFCAFFVYKPQL